MLQANKKTKVFKTAILLFLLFASFYEFFDIVKDVLWEKEVHVDNAIFDIIDYFVNPRFTKAMVVISFLGSAYFLVPAYLVLIVWLLVEKKKQVALNTALIGITSSGLVFLLKILFRRTRPINPISNPALTFSFPSGHSTTAFILFGLLIHLVWHSRITTGYKYAASTGLLTLSLLVGISRIYLRQHFASDVLAGFCAGYAWLWISIWTLKKMES